MTLIGLNWTKRVNSVVLFNYFLPLALAGIGSYVVVSKPEPDPNPRVFGLTRPEPEPEQKSSTRRSLQRGNK